MLLCERKPKRWMMICVLPVLLFSGGIRAQDTLSVSEAITIALEQNFAVRIARNTAAIASNEDTPGNAGMLPVLSADGTLTQRQQDNIVGFAAGSIPDRRDLGVETNVVNYGADITWTVFDGLTMFATADRLGLQADLGELDAQIQVEQVLSDIITTYFELVGQQQAYRVLEGTLGVSEERIRIAETKLDLGSGSEYDLLQARADLIADRSALIRAGTGLEQARILIRQLIGDEDLPEIRASGEIELAEPLILQQMLDEALIQNRELTRSRVNQEVASTRIKELTGEWFPQIDVSGGYRYNRVEASAGFTEFNESSGFTYGVTARVNLFEGFNRSRRIQNARIEQKNETLRIEELELAVEAGVRQLYAQYENALELILLEEENLEYTRQSLDIALERYRLGTINAVELREAQLTLLQAQNRLITARLEAKTAETELLRLSGRLLSKAD